LYSSMSRDPVQPHRMSGRDITYVVYLFILLFYLLNCYVVRPYCVYILCIPEALQQYTQRGGARLWIGHGYREKLLWPISYAV